MTRSLRERRDPRSGSRRLAFVAVGVALSIVACGGNRAAPALDGVVGPVALVDQFELGYGFWECDAYLEPSEPFESDLGIDSRIPGFISANPQRESLAGDAATLGVFMREAGLVLTDERVSFTPGVDLFAGDMCNSGPGEVYVLVWSRPAGPPDLIRRSDLSDIVLAPDGGVVVVAFAAPQETIPLPPWVGGPPSDVVTTSTVPVPTTEPEDVEIGFEIRAVSGVGPEPCTVNQFLDGTECLGVSLPLVTRADIVDVELVETADSVGLRLVMTPEGLDAFNAMAAGCFAPVPACRAGQFAVILDGEVLARSDVEQDTFEADAIVIGSFDPEAAASIADTILRTPIVEDTAVAGDN